MQSHKDEMQETSHRKSTKQEERKVTILHISLSFTLHQSQPSEHIPESHVWCSPSDYQVLEMASEQPGPRQHLQENSPLT